VKKNKMLRKVHTYLDVRLVKFASVAENFIMRSYLFVLLATHPWLRPTAGCHCCAGPKEQVFDNQRFEPWETHSAI
jgi:hypothetical protein